MDIFYASHDGHTARIATVLAGHLEKNGLPVRLHDLMREAPPDALLAATTPCLLIAAIRYGFHLAPAQRLLQHLAPLTPQKRLYLFSVNLTARKTAKQSATTNAYLRKWLRKTGARPVLAEALAGKLDYPRYTAFDRTIIRFIMTLTRGPTDPKAVVDFTPWPRIEALAAQIAAMEKALKTGG